MNASRFWRAVRDELAPSPGRGIMTSRFVVASAVIITASMALEVPFLAIGLIAAFFATQENLALTRNMSIFGLFGLVIAIGSSILLMRYCISVPLLRILAGCALCFCGVYLLQVSGPLRLAGFLTALAAIYTQSLPDTIPDGEAITRILLWVLMAGFYPVSVTLLVAFFCPRSRSARQLKADLDRAMDRVIGQLEARRCGTVPPLDLDAVEEGITRRRRHLDFACQDDREFFRDRGRHLVRIATVERLLLAGARLAVEGPGVGAAPQLEPLVRACMALRTDLARDRSFHPDPELDLVAASHGPDAALAEMAGALRALGQAEAAPSPEFAPPPGERLMRPGAFSSPVYAKVALRTVLAAMICYVFQAWTDWPGIHTAMLTCVILAMPPLGVASLGGISHKGVVRVLGAVLGSAFALFQTVFILPHLDGITGLLAMTLPVMALGGWIASGSSKSHYVGRQLVFTYAMALLGRFTLTPDLPEIRDRIVGIFLGVAVYLLMSTVVWPSREHESLRATLGRAVRGLARLARTGRERAPLAPGLGQVDAVRQECWTLLRQARDLEVRVALEPGEDGLPDIGSWNLHAAFTDIRGTLFAADGFQAQLQRLEPGTRPDLEHGLAAFREDAGRRLDRIADQLEGGACVSDDPRPEPAVAWGTAGASADPKVRDLFQAAQTLYARIVQLGARLTSAAPQPAEEP
jgi:multidrug resistance protein MdtO